jgi:uncharacterized protein YkwD
VAQVFLKLAVEQRHHEATISTKLAQLIASPASTLLTNLADISSFTPTPTLAPTSTPAPEFLEEKVIIVEDLFANDPVLKDAEWGQAVQVSETGYRMKVGFDDVMATPQDTFAALNVYRNTKGKSTLTWDDRLATYATERATYICQNGSDGHAGFAEYVKNQEGYKTLGFYNLGENMSVHMKMIGTHLIEWIYAADQDHDTNQLDDWSHVGVGIYDDCSSLIFAALMI